MKRTHLVAALIAVAVVAIITADARAVYHPGMGRFLQRDPGPGSAMPARTGSAGPAATGSFIPRDPTGSNQYADGMSLYQYVGGNPVTYLDPLGLAKFQCCIGRDGKRAQGGGTTVSNDEIHREILQGAEGQLKVFAWQDIQDFGQAVYNQRTYTSFTPNRLPSVSIAKKHSDVLGKVREGIIDCFTDKQYYKEYLKGKYNAQSGFTEVNTLARGVYSETTTWNISILTKISLASVIENRKNLPNFPNTYLGVLQQPAQFSGWPAKAATYAMMKGKKQKFFWAMSYAAAVMVDGSPFDWAGGADHFYSPYINTPQWAQGAKPITNALPVEHVRNVVVERDAKGRPTKYYHGVSFLFFDLIDEKGNWR